MAKFTPLPVLSSYSSADKMNSNFTKAATAIENTVSRDGTGPNSMGADFDMNSNYIVNLPSPLTASQAATKGYVDSLAGPLSLTSVAWGNVLTTPTTLVGYGILDAPSEITVKTNGTIQTKITANTNTVVQSGIYAETPITLPFGKSLEIKPGGVLSGTYTNNGLTLRSNYSATAWTDWNDATSTTSFEGISAELGSYGNRSFGGLNIPSTISGAVSIPSSSTAGPHATGISGWAKTASTTTGAVPLFGKGDSLATSCLAWGLNTVTQDNNHATTVWGYEVDLNVDNINTSVLGVQVTGGSTVEPSLAIGFQVAPINPFTSPTKRWSTAFDVQDGSAIIGMSLGAITKISGGPAPINAYKTNGAGTRSLAYSINGDTTGNANMILANTAAILDIGISDGLGGSNKNFRAYTTKSGIGYNGLPTHTCHVGGDLCISPGASSVPATNGEITFEFTDNTHMTVRAKGSDGTVRTNVLVLA